MARHASSLIDLCRTATTLPLFSISLVHTLLPPANLAFGYTTTVVTMLPPAGHDDRSIGFGLSSDGSTVVGSSIENTPTDDWLRQPALWTGPTPATLIGVLPGYDAGYARTTNHNGTAVAGNCYTNTPTGGTSAVFYWTAAGGIQNVGSLAGGSTYGGYISDTGNVVVGWEWGAGAFKWTPELGIQQLAAPAGYSQANLLARNISGDGTVIVGHYNGFNYLLDEAVRWDSNGDAEILSRPAGGSSTYAYSVNVDGSVVAGVSWMDAGSGPAGQLVRWSGSGEPEVLGVLAGGGHTIPFDVSADGSVIVGMDQRLQTGFIWHESIGIVSLYDYLFSSGVDLTGWSRFSDVQGISADGSTVSGTGVYNGFARAFMISGLSFAPVPGGGIACFFALFTSCIAGRRRCLRH